MRTFHYKFTGRLRLALGIKYPCEKTVEAETQEKAYLKLYEIHEHIHVDSVHELIDGSWVKRDKTGNHGH